MSVGSGEMEALAHFPGRDGGGATVREFASESDPDTQTQPVPDAAPRYSRAQAVADGGTGATTPDYRLEPDRTELRRHREYGDVQTKAIEETPGDDQNDVYMGAFCRELVEHSQRDGHFWLGYGEQGRRLREVGITAEQLRQHFFITGASGAGKSTLAEICILQHVWAGRGCAVIDPHNDLVDDIMAKIPEQRKDDVIVLDPADLDAEYTHTINFLSVEVDEDHDDYEAAVNGAVADTIGVIAQGAQNIGDRMEDVLYGLTRGMIVSERSYTLLDMRSVLRNEERRQAFAKQMRDEGYDYLADFADDLTDMSDDDLAPVVRLLNKWVLSRTAREIINHTDSSIAFSEAIDQDKIILLRNDLADESLQQLVATAVFKRPRLIARQHRIESSE